MTMTAIEHLRKLAKKHPRDIEGYCFWCYCEHDDPHDPDCPWVAAREFIGRCDASERFLL
jgi:hypothetical protein